MDAASILTKVDEWAEAFKSVLDRWDRWLMEVHQLHLQGAFLQLANLQDAGLAIVRDFAVMQDHRTSLLEEASQHGWASRGLTELCERLEGNAKTERGRRFRAFAPRLRHLQQHSVALWVLAFQSQSHVSQLLQILSTGDADSATYNPEESQSLGGGRLVDQAA